MNYPWESNEVGYNKDDTTIPQRVGMQCSDCKYLNVILLDESCLHFMKQP
jgi:hypothetical protein